MANNNGGGVHDDYLNAPDTAGRPMALMSLLLVFLVIAAVAFALFLGGRWVYDQYVKDDESSQIATEEEMNQEAGTSEQAESEGSGSSTDDSNGQPASSSDNSGDPQSANNQSSNQQDSDSNSAGSSSATSDSGQESGTTGQSYTATDEPAAAGEQHAAASAVTGPETEEVPNTGPGSLLAVFIGATLLGTILHRKWLISKL